MLVSSGVGEYNSSEPGELSPPVRSGPPIMFEAKNTCRWEDSIPKPNVQQIMAQPTELVVLFEETNVDSVVK